MIYSWRLAVSKSRKYRKRRTESIMFLWSVSFRVGGGVMKGGGGRGGRVCVCLSVCVLCTCLCVYVIYILVNNKPPRKALAENVGTFMPTCCFSLIFISYIYIDTQRERCV